MTPYNVLEVLFLIGIAAAFALGYWRGHVAGHHAGFMVGFVAAMDPGNDVEVIRSRPRFPQEDVDDLK